MERSNPAHTQLHLFDPDTLDPWKLACGRLVLVIRNGAPPRSLTGLAQLTGITPAELRRYERLADKSERAA